MRTILHCDLNNFYASVECLRYPEIAHLPVAVTGDPEKRHGIILAKNNVAKKFGIQTGEVIWKAQQKCPNLVCVAPHYDDYVTFSEKVFDIYTQYTDRVEAFGPDECWLDVTHSRGLFGDGKQIADRIRDHVRKETGLTLSAGVSWNKPYAKLGSDLKKPDATTVITPENRDTVVYPLPCSDMLMVGRATREKLARINVHTIGDLANADEKRLHNLLGINGVKLRKSARGEDDEEVRLYFNKRVPESVGHGITATRDLATHNDVTVVTYFLCDMIARRLRRYGLSANAVSVDLRDCDLMHRTYQAPLPYATATADEIAKAVLALALPHFREGEDAPLRTLSISTFKLTADETERQLSLFDPADLKKDNRRAEALDRVYKRFGKNAITRAILMAQDIVYDKTESEDFLPFKR